MRRSSSRPWAEWVLPSGLLVGLVAYVYAPARNVFFVNEDFTWLWRCGNAPWGALVIRDVMEGSYSWRPWAQLTFAVQARLWGWNPLPLHQWALAWHCAAAAVLFLALRRCCSPWAAFWGTLVFAVHPLQVESLAWASAVSGPLSTAWLCVGVLGALCLGVPWSAASLVFFLALAAQENALIGWPLLVAGLCMLREEREEQRRERLRSLVGFSTAALLFLALRHWASPAAVAPPGSAFAGLGAASVLHALPVALQRFGEGVSAVIGLHSSLVGWGLWVVVLVCALGRLRRGDGLALFGLFWFTAALFPYTFLFFGLAPRYYHLPLAGLGIAAASLLAAAVPRPTPQWAWAAKALAAGLACLWLAAWQGPIRAAASVWAEKGRKTQALLGEIRQLVPEPPRGAHFAFYGLGDLRLREGVFVFGLDDALRLLYRDGSIQVAFRPLGEQAPGEIALWYDGTRLWRLGEQR